MTPKKAKDNSSWLSPSTKRRLIVGSSIVLGVIVDGVASPVVQDVAQGVMPSNTAFSVLWHIATIGVAAVIFWAILRKLFGW